MNSYQFFADDQHYNNWLAHSEQEEAPYVVIRPKYERLLCPKCKRFDHDRVFAEGFEENVRIRARGNIIQTEDGFYCVDSRVKEWVELHHIKGVALKALPGTDWNVMSVTCRVEADRSDYSYSKASCAVCSRSNEITGVILLASRIAAPQCCGTFFAPEFDRVGGFSGNRDVFVTEDVVLGFKELGLKGGTFQRLLSAEEEPAFRAAVERKQAFKWPKGARIVL